LELRVSHLQSRHSAAYVTPPVHFALVILEKGEQIVSPTVSQNWLQTEASHVARIADVSHWHLAALVIFLIRSHVSALSSLDLNPPIFTSSVDGILE
jgi:hypothetical protein